MVLGRVSEQRQMEQIKAKMQALRAQADAAEEKNIVLEKKLKETEAQLHAV